MPHPCEAPRGVRSQDPERRTVQAGPRDGAEGEVVVNGDGFSLGDGRVPEMNGGDGRD